MNKEKIYVKVDSTFDPTVSCNRHQSHGRMDVPSQSKQCVTSALQEPLITVTLVTVLPCSSRGRKSTCSLSALIHASTVG